MAQMPDPFPSLLARIKRMEDRLNQRLASSPFFGTGVHPNGNQGLDSDNYVAGASGFSLNGGTGNAEFNDITLRDLPNSALANPVVPGVVNQVATNFAIPGTSNTTIVSYNAPVPTDCTRLLVHVTGDAFVVNPNTTGGSNGAGSDIIIANLTCGGDSGLPMGVSISGSNGQTSVHCSLASLLTGLTPGGTVTLTLQARAGFQSFGGANPTNQANLSASLFWLR